MIIVKNRELLVPKNEQFIGMNLDESSETRWFKVDRVLPGQIDIANYTFVADIVYADDTPDVISLTKEIQDDYIILGITFTSAIMSAHAGNLWISLRATSTGGNSWSTASANMYIFDRVLNPGTVVASSALTELEQLEVNLETNEGLRNTAETNRASAETSRVNAESGRVSAETGRVNAEALRVAAENQRSQHYRDNTLIAEGYAVGKQDGVDVPSSSPYYHNNSKYYAETECVAEKLKAEGYAVGTQNGVYVTEESPYYHNNSKYYSENAHGQFVIRYNVTTWASIIDAYQHGRNLVFMKYDSQAFVDTPIFYQLCKVTKSSLGSEILYKFFFLNEFGGGYQLSKNGDENPPNCTVIHSGIKADDLDDGVQFSITLANSAYQKPSSGIPSTDMSSAVQTSLGKADNAESKGKLTIGGVSYDIEITNVDPGVGTAGKIIIVTG